MARPFKEPVTNLQECFNDFLVLEISYCLIIFSDFVPNKKAQYTMGWVVCGMIGFNIFVNLSFIVFVSISTAAKRAKVYWAKAKRSVSRCWHKLRPS